MPDFSQQTYWDSRFQNDSKPYDWLLPASALCSVTKDMIPEKSTLDKAEILHIGCGTSDALALRELVAKPGQIHNVDYSQAAIGAGERREREVREEKDLLPDAVESEGDKAEGGGKHDSAFQDVISTQSEKMRWSHMDLLSLHSTLALLHHQLQEERTLYDLILDKSTSDSISCGQDNPLTLPYPLSINGWTRRLQGSGTTQSGSVHPLHLLAVHLAALTTPRTGRWIAISYSEDRFPFLPPYPTSKGAGMLDDEVIKAGFPHPSQLWKLERKEKVEMVEGKGEEEETLAERKKRLSREGYVHRPKVGAWVYVLRRTEAVVHD